MVEILHPSAGKIYETIGRTDLEAKKAVDMAFMHCFSLGMEIYKEVGLE